jgi:hypothetical protein
MGDRAKSTHRFHRGSGDSTYGNGLRRNKGSLPRQVSGRQPGTKRPTRKGRGRSGQMAEGFVVPTKPGNAGGGKEP